MRGRVTIPSADLAQQLEALVQGKHVCSIHEDLAEEMTAAVAFLKSGLARGERCLYLGAVRTAGDVADALAVAGIDVERVRRDGALSLLLAQDVYLGAGHFDLDAMTEFLRDGTTQAAVSGFAGLRVASQMAWALGTGAGTERLIEYEAALNRLCPGGRLTVLCQYDRFQFAPVVIRDVLRTHPVVILADGVAWDNLYYEPPDLVLAPPSVANRVQWMLRQLWRVRGTEIDAQRELLQVIINNVPAGIALLSVPSYAYELVNPVFQAFVPDVQMLGNSYAEVWPDLARETIPLIEEAVRTQQARQLTDLPLDITRNPGGTVERAHFSFAYVPLRLPPAERERLLVLATETTERKLMEVKLTRLNGDLEQRIAERTAALETANHELEAFSYSVSHDLRAPLRAMQGSSRILLEQYGPDLSDEPRSHLTVIRDNAQHMSRLIDDLISFTHLSGYELRRETVAPAALVRSVLDVLQDEPDARHARVRVGELPLCAADPVLLQQVFANLLSNALKFSRRSAVAQVEVGWREDAAGPGRGAYFVRDNGMGFDMCYAGSLFALFQRLHEAEEYEGTGVGLAIVQRIVRLHGGRVWAEAEVGKGATFYFTLLEEGGDD